MIGAKAFKLAATRAQATRVTRFLYMVVLYMAPNKQHGTAPGQRLCAC